MDKSHRIEQKLKMMEEDFSMFIERNFFPLCIKERWTHS